MNTARGGLVVFLALLTLAGPPHAWAADGPPAPAPALPPVVTSRSAVRVWVDWIGYRTADPKVAVVASDGPLPADLRLSLHEVHTGRGRAGKDLPVKPFGKGRRDVESDEFVAHLDLDLGAARAPGRFYVRVGDGTGAERSHLFTVADDVYRGPAAAAWRMYYHQRAGAADPERRAGPSHESPPAAAGGPGASRPAPAVARVFRWDGRSPHWGPVGTAVVDPTPRDVAGGWWDGADFNRYLGNTARAHNLLLLGVQLLGGRLTDGQLDLPESGNGVPDALDETRRGTEFLLRMADDAGAAFGRAYAADPAGPVQLTVPTSGATMARAAALAYAAVVWDEARPAVGGGGRAGDPFARQCREAAERGWRLLAGKPHPWPADPRNPTRTANTGAWYDPDYDAARALAAACLFRLTGEAAYHDAAKASFAALAGLPDRGPGEGADWWPAVWVYAGTPGADPAVARKAKAVVARSADLAVRQTGPARGYSAGVRGYWWGSNRLVGECGVNCLLAAHWADGPAARRRYENAALEYLHYLFGRNPVGRCYLTNMTAFGAENSLPAMHHARFGPAAGGPGPPSGFVVGSANGGMKRFNPAPDDEPWAYISPGLDYQAPAALLIGYFGFAPPAPDAGR